MVTGDVVSDLFLQSCWLYFFNSILVGVIWSSYSLVRLIGTSPLLEELNRMN